MRNLCALLFALSFIGMQPSRWRKIQINGTAQGTTYHITYYAADSTVTRQQVDSILDKIDTSLSIYNPSSLITWFNNSDTGIIMDDHFRQVVKKSLSTWQQTGGIFDITVEPLVQAWGFGPQKITALPDPATLKTLKACVSSNNLY